MLTSMHLRQGDLVVNERGQSGIFQRWEGDKAVVTWFGQAGTEINLPYQDSWEARARRAEAELERLKNGGG